MNYLINNLLNVTLTYVTAKDKFSHIIFYNSLVIKIMLNVNLFINIVQFYINVSLYVYIRLPTLFIYRIFKYSLINKIKLIIKIK